MPKEEYISKKELKANGIGVLLGAKEIELTNEQVIEILDSQRPKPYYKTINMAYDKAIETLKEPQIIRCKDCKHHWTHKYMDSMPIEICDLAQTFYDAEYDFCSLAERRTE